MPALTLPLTPGAQEVSDPALSGLAAFLAWTLNRNLDPRIAGMVTTPSEAVPTGHLFEWDLAEEQGQYIKLVPPALYVCWRGQATLDWLTIHRQRQKRILHALYVWDERPGQEALHSRRGIFAMVDRVWSEAVLRGYHALYAPNGDATLGQRLCNHIPGLRGMTYLGGRGIKRVAIDEGREAADISDHRNRISYPAFEAQIEVVDYIDRTDNPPDGTALAGTSVAVSVNSEDVEDDVLVMNRTVS